MPLDTPFRVSGRVTGDEFFGRTDEIRAMAHHLRSRSNVALCGPARAGKTSLLTLVFRNYRRAEKDAWTWFVDLKNLQTLDELVAEFFYGMKSTETSYTLRDLARQLKQWERRLVLFIDNGDRFAAPPFNEEALFALLASHLPAQTISLCVATTLAPEALFKNTIGLPLHSFFIHCDLPPFSPMECAQFIKQRLQWTGVYFRDDEIDMLIEQSGGQPSELQRGAAELFRRKMSEKEDSSPQHTTAPRRKH